MSTLSPTSAGRQPALPAVLWPLLFGNFVIGSGVMVVPGTLNEISSSLQVSVAAGGQLISAGALLGWLIAHGAMDQLHWVGFAVLVLAMSASALASRYQGTRRS